MKIHTIFSRVGVDELYFTSKTTVVIDVLRASTTILAALTNKAREIIPVDSFEFAMKVSGSAFSGQTLLGGERNSKKVDGFLLGNSPLEYSEEIVKGKSIILYTSNGSKAIVKARYSKNLFICSFNNIESIANNLVRLNDDFTILCAGANKQFSLEDAVCAGNLISLMKQKSSSLKFSDASKAAQVLYNKFKKDIENMLRNSCHGKELIDLGFEEDISFASQINSCSTIPYFKNGVLKSLAI